METQHERPQAGVIPYRNEPHRLEVLLVTTRRTGRWIIPKGNVEPGERSHESAEREAFEEAGIEGRVTHEALGTYVHDKRSGPRKVQVHPMRVHNELDDWPESDERRRRWVSVHEAPAYVRERGLKLLLHRFTDYVQEAA